MPRDSRNSRELWRERQALHRAIAAVQNALARLDTALAQAPVQPMPPIQRRGKQAFKPPLNGAAQKAWRDARRSGHPPRIDCDPELKAFILANLPGSTYAATVKAIAAAFPPERCVKISSLQRWWTQHKPPGQTQPSDPA